MGRVTGVPWQVVITGAMLMCIAYLLSVTAGLVAGYFGVASMVVVSQAIGLLLVLMLVPVLLNLSRSFYGVLLLIYLSFVMTSILQYALVFQHHGLISSAGRTRLFTDAIYFSVTTWTTLGYGDLLVEPHMRLATSAEALTGTVSIALGVSFFWLYVTEQLVPRDRALLDGRMLHTKSLTTHYMRVWSLGGRLRFFGSDYIDPLDEGTVVYWDTAKHRWTPVAEGDQPPTDAHVMRFGRHRTPTAGRPSGNTDA